MWNADEFALAITLMIKRLQSLAALLKCKNLKEYHEELLQVINDLVINGLFHTKRSKCLEVHASEEIVIL